MKKCPFCAEEIQEAAVKCRYCHEFLDGQAQGIRGVERTKWYFSTSTLIIGFCFVGPLILPLIWIHPQYSRTKKAVLTLVCIAVTIVLIIVTQDSLSKLSDTYQALQGTS